MDIWLITRLALFRNHELEIISQFIYIRPVNKNLFMIVDKYKEINGYQIHMDSLIEKR